MGLVRLEAGEAALHLAPDTGGCVERWTIGAWDVLRPTLTGASDPRDFAAFPMVPFVGRIAEGRFTFEGRDIALPPNMPPEPHAIHGQGWQVPWRLARQARSSATLVYEHDGSIWPWTYRAEQKFDLAEDRLDVTLRLTNTSVQAMPGGLGWHPYFPRGDAEITADVTAIWNDDTPKALDSTSDLTTLRSVSSLHLDHAFSAGSARVAIGWPGRALAMTASSPCLHLVVYVPPDEDFFCVEPVSHVPDAVNSALSADLTGYRVLGPGEAMTTHIRLAAVIQ